MWTRGVRVGKDNSWVGSAEPWERTGISKCGAMFLLLFLFRFFGCMFCLWQAGGHHAVPQRNVGGNERLKDELQKVTRISFWHFFLMVFGIFLAGDEGSDAGSHPHGARPRRLDHA
jgi:hypothetical protein